jgi:hypothetical protein
LEINHVQSLLCSSYFALIDGVTRLMSDEDTQTRLDGQLLVRDHKSTLTHAQDSAAKKYMLAYASNTWMTGWYGGMMKATINTKTTD